MSAKSPTNRSSPADGRSKVSELRTVNRQSGQNSDSGLPGVASIQSAGLATDSHIIPHCLSHTLVNISFDFAGLLTTVSRYSHGKSCGSDIVRHLEYHHTCRGHRKTAKNRICGLLLVEDQLQCHGLSIGVNTRRCLGHGFAIAGNHDASAGVIFCF